MTTGPVRDHRLQACYTSHDDVYSAIVGGLPGDGQRADERQRQPGTNSGGGLSGNSTAYCAAKGDIRPAEQVHRTDHTRDLTAPRTGRYAPPPHELS